MFGKWIEFPVTNLSPGQSCVVVLAAGWSKGVVLRASSGQDFGCCWAEEQVTPFYLWGSSGAVDWMDPEQGELKYMVHFSMHLNPFPFPHYVFCRRFSLALWKNVFSYTQTQGLLGGHCHSLAELWDIGTSKHTQSSHWFHLYSDFPCAFMAPAPKVYNKLGHFISVFPWKHFGTFWPGRMSWHCWKNGDFSCMCCLSWGGREFF